jgi:2-keto-4-pentenoate hydratase/2-oxohepta-3-ene-1,7-dioic acid hydratase in catechol pathway
MRICRFITGDSTTPRFGILQNDLVLPFLDQEQFENFHQQQTGAGISKTNVTFLAPVSPSKVVCVGRNYREHAAELGNKMPEEPMLFLKPPSAVIASEDSIEIPSASQQVEHEGELGVVIGRKASKLSDAEDPLDYVLGYTCVNDVTARDLQRKDVQFTRGKSFDTFCPVGPFIVSDLDPLNLVVTTRLNGNLKQRGQTADMAFPVPFLIRYISNIMTLLPGDLIATGTPAGVSPMKDGDVVEVEIEGIGILRNPVRA